MVTRNDTLGNEHEWCHRGLCLAILRPPEEGQVGPRQGSGISLDEGAPAISLNQAHGGDPRRWVQRRSWDSSSYFPSGHRQAVLRPRRDLRYPLDDRHRGRLFDRAAVPNLVVHI
jgi:hypothetical protein